MILSSICTVKTMEKSWKINIKPEKTRLFYEFHSEITQKYRKTRGKVKILTSAGQLLPKKHRVFRRFPFFGNKKTKKHVYFTVLDDKISPNTEKTQVFGRFYVNPLAGVEPRSFTDSRTRLRHTLRLITRHSCWRHRLSW